MDFQNKRTFTEKKDSISKLPENIIHLILSFLPLKCAVETSILSRQWINMWKPLWIYTTIIDFDEEFTTNLKKTHYVQAVHQLLQLHTLDKVKKFRMFFCPGDRYSSDLIEWIEFVKVKGVGELVLDLSGNVRHSDSTDDDDIRSPLLEDLTMSYCNSLKSVKIDHLQLKILTLESCFNVEEMEIRTPNLKNLQYKGQVCDNPIFNDVSSINEATLLLIHDEVDYELHLWKNFLTKLSRVSSLEVKLTSTHPVRFHLPNSTMFFYIFGVDQAKMSKFFSYTLLSFSPLEKKIYIQISRYNDITECHVTKMTSVATLLYGDYNDYVVKSS
ncbi:F-box/LRR-repeat protein At3g26922-like [Aristolochia californica]|uniref:F-box/LRR-repeat protein At3g26922-like n=1 Tax=Aristolochia californica TaxID=171875 RepID=UPI0035E126F6